MRDPKPSSRAEPLLKQAAWLRRLASRLVLDEAEADDVVQEAYAAALSRSAADPPVHQPRAYLAGLLRNVIRMQGRSAAHRNAREEQVAREERLPSASELVEQAELTQRLGREVLGMREPYRRTLLLSFFEGLSSAEIARREGVPSSTVRNRIKRALEELHARLDEGQGGRREWALSLIPLAIGPPSVRLPVPNPESDAAPSASAAPTAGGISMIAKFAIVLSAAAMLTTWVASGGDTATQTRPPLSTDGPSAPTEGTIALVQDESQDERKPVELPPKKIEQLISGRVLDEGGKAFAHAEVFVGGQPTPFDEPPTAGVFTNNGEALGAEQLQAAVHNPSGWFREGAALGKLIQTDAQGHFSLTLEAPARVFVCLPERPGLRRLSGTCGWHDTPAREVVFRARRVPTATLELRLVDETTGKAVKPFAGTFGPVGAKQREFSSARASTEWLVELEKGAPRRFRVSVTMPPWAVIERELTLSVGATEVLELRVRSGAGFTGRVVDATGLPIEGAFVFWGDTQRLRKRGLFRGLSADHLADAVRTDATGSFSLPGWTDAVTAWHPEHSPRTLRSTQATLIALPRSGRISGTVLDQDGLPIAEHVVRIDRQRETTTDGAGHFEFQGLPAGPHAIDVEGRRWIGARLEPGEQLVLPELRPLADVELTVDPATPELLERLGGLYTGSGKVFGTGEWGARAGTVNLRSPYPGPHLFVSMRGQFAWVEISEPQAVMNFGDADLTLRAPAGSRVWIEPAELGQIASWQVRRMTREVPDSGELRYAPLPVGTFRLGIKDGESEILVNVTGQGGQAVLR